MKSFNYERTQTKGEEKETVEKDFIVWKILKKVSQHFQFCRKTSLQKRLLMF